MLHLLRRHRQRLGRTFAGLLALAWMTLALQPCAYAAAKPVVAPEVHAVHAMAHHGNHSMHAMAMSDSPTEKAPCTTGEDCSVFNAVEKQAAPTAADPLKVSFQTAPAVAAYFPVPALPIVRQSFDRRVAFVPVSPPPILEFRVLRI